MMYLNRPGKWTIILGYSLPGSDHLTFLLQGLRAKVDKMDTCSLSLPKATFYIRVHILMTFHLFYTQNKLALSYDRRRSLIDILLKAMFSEGHNNGVVEGIY